MPPTVIPTPNPTRTNDKIRPDAAGPTKVFEPDDDDRLVGRVLTRREVLALMGAASVSVMAAACAPGSVASSAGSTAAASASSGATATTALATASAVAVASSLPSCVVVPELTEGPYYVNENLDRSDIRVDTSTGKAVDGSVLKIDWLVSQVDGNACIPLEGVLVDVWHCDALGNYSDVDSQQGHDYLRGYQHTNAKGLATITTIYPGWYQGRAVHIHFKIRTDAAATSGFQFTSQLFFDDALSGQVYGQGAYASKGSPDVKNTNDGIYQQSKGMTLLDAVKDGNGYKATFEIALQTT
jgi:protocatechuate 3,4-dioxygenase beta subunit